MESASQQRASTRREVLKFGGSTLVDPACLETALGLSITVANSGSAQVVVSALGDTTDDLLAAVRAASSNKTDIVATILEQITRRASEVYSPLLGTGAATTIQRTLREVEPLLAAIAALGDAASSATDRVVGHGEVLSARLFTEALRARGADAIDVDARGWVTTDDRFGRAEVLWPETRDRFTERWPSWSRHAIAVHTGFIGATVDGRPTTLGRNGSDYTAAILARLTGASELTVWTDVPGVMTADPRLVSDAYVVPSLSFREALELSNLGLTMFHSRTMIPLLDGGITLRIRSASRPEEAGTRVDDAGDADPLKPTCVVSLEGLALLSIEGSHRTAAAEISARSLSVLRRDGVDLRLATLAHRGNGAAFAVAESDSGRALQLVHRELAREIAEGELLAPVATSPVSVVTLVAEAMGRRPNVAGRFFGALGRLGINVRAATQGATSRAISCVVDDAHTALAVRAVHAAFNLAVEQVSVLVLGKGVVGGKLIGQIASERARLARDHGVEVRLVGLADRRALVFRDEGIAPEESRQLLDASPAARDLHAALRRLARLPGPVLVDCTAAEDMDELYRTALAHGVHVVTANKKPFTTTLDRRRALFASAARAHRGLRYETTVGAALPVVETLKNLRRTGDEVRLIEGSLSGTLGFLANEVSSGAALSAAVRLAHARGYTEPHPRDDLSGLDVARKALILARELGMEVELGDVVVTPLVPRRLLEQGDREAFFGALEDADAAFAAQLDALRRDGKVLRYLARLTPGSSSSEGKPLLEVGPVGVELSHPAARLRGTEALVAFHTARYQEHPLIVQGAGAGGAVTASGVLADVLSLTRLREAG